MNPNALTRTNAFAALFAVAIASGCTPTVGATVMNNDNASTMDTSFDPAAQVQPATQLLHRYATALNNADVDAIIALYSDEGVFMAQHRSPAIGRDQIEVAYREILGMIRLDIEFEIDEVVVVSPTVAYARTRSAGSTTILANDAQVSEANQELFVLVREDASGDWRIGRYIFATTQARSDG